MPAPCCIRALSLTVLIPVCALEAGTCDALAAAQPFKAALVIGNSHYTSIPGLANPQHDASDMCQALRSIGFKATCLVDVDTRVRLRAVIEDFVDSVPEGAVSVIYYTGHGLQVHGKNYLVPTAAHLTDEASVPGSTVSLSFLMRQLRRENGYLRMVILDACRDNPLSTPALALPAGLAQVTDIPEDTQVMFATAAGQPAVDGTGRNGTFTKNLLEHLREPGTVDDLFKAVSQGVQSDTEPLGRTQRPAVYTNFSGQYCLVRCTSLEEAREQAPAAAQQALAEESLGRKEQPPAAVKPAQPHRSSFVPPAL